MSRFHALALILLASSAPMGCAAKEPPPPEPKVQPKDQIELKDHINVKLDEMFPSDLFPNNNLKTLPTGMQKLGDVTYEIGNGVLQLGGSGGVVGKPEKITGIKVERTADRLHILQGTGNMTYDGTVISKYVIRYADQTTTSIEVVYGKHVVDWWVYPGLSGPTESKAVWEGENEAAKGFRAKIKLYHQEWSNPHPEKVIATIDFELADEKRLCAPFCVAITAEAARELGAGQRTNQESEPK